MRILFVVPYTPSLIRFRSYNLIRALSQLSHTLTVLTLTSNSNEVAQARQLETICEVLTHPLPRWRSLTNALLALPSRSPLQANYSWQPSLAQHLVRLVGQGHHDIVHVEHLRGARYGLYLRQRLSVEDRPPIIWDSVDCITHLFRQASRHSRGIFGRLVTRLELGPTERYERWLLTQFERVLVTSPADRDALLDVAGESAQVAAPISVIPIGVDLQYFQPGPGEKKQQNELVFSGKMSYHANITMAHFLVTEIMPLVWEQRPDVRLIVVGKDPPRDVRALAEDSRIVVTGSVPDIRPYLQRAAVAVAPVRYGAGIQSKILEAMACGTATVTTPRALRGLTATAGRDLLVADDAPSFAASILSLLADDTRRKTLAAAGLKYVETHHRWPAIAMKLQEVYRAAIES